MIDFSTLHGGYVRDLQDQPAVLAGTVERLHPSPELLRIAAEAKGGAYDRIVLTGMGGSFHVLVPLHIDMIERGWNCFLAETSELIHSMPRLLDGRPLVIALSQSGQSAELVRLAAMEARRGEMIAVTNTPGSPLAEAAGAVVQMHAGTEFSVSCKTSVASLAVLRWLGEVVSGGDADAAARDLALAAPAASSYLERWRAHVGCLAAELSGVQNLFLVGRGRSLAASGLGSGIIKEAAHFHAEGMSAAAFRHGPMEMLTRDAYVVVFCGEPALAPFAESLAADVLATGARAALVGSGAALDPFRLPAAPQAVLPILEILPAQMMSVALAAISGREPGRFEHITKVTTME